MDNLHSKGNGTHTLVSLKKVTSLAKYYNRFWIMIHIYHLSSEVSGKGKTQKYAYCPSSVPYIMLTLSSLGKGRGS